MCSLRLQLGLKQNLNDHEYRYIWPHYLSIALVYVRLPPQLCCNPSRNPSGSTTSQHPFIPCMPQMSQKEDTVSSWARMLAVHLWQVRKNLLFMSMARSQGVWLIVHAEITSPLRHLREWQILVIDCSWYILLNRRTVCNVLCGHNEVNCISYYIVVSYSFYCQLRGLADVDWLFLGKIANSLCSKPVI